MVGSVSALTGISTCIDFQNINSSQGEDYYLMNDIDCTGSRLWTVDANFTGFKPIDNFTGTLDGRGYNVDGLYSHISSIPHTSYRNFGVFRSMSGFIYDINFVDINLTVSGTGVENIGLVGELFGNISNTKVSGFITGVGYSYLGGFSGYHVRGQILDSLSNLTLNGSVGSGGLGGFSGYMSDRDYPDNTAVIGRCKSSSMLIGDAQLVGGLVGNEYYGYIYSSYFDGAIDIDNTTSLNYVGGLVGNCNGIIWDSYGDGTLAVVMSNNTFIGGLVGAVQAGCSMWNSFSGMTTSVTGRSLYNGSIAGYQGGSIVHTYYLDQLNGCVGTRESGVISDCPQVTFTSYFTDYGNEPVSYWDFINYWDSSFDGILYPRLQWEETSITTDTGVSCSFPLIFCDTFSYKTSLYNNGWKVKNRNGNTNAEFTPTGYEVIWNATNPYTISHTIDPFPTNYTLTDGNTIYNSIYAPSFSQEFDLQFNNSIGADGSDSEAHLSIYTYDRDGDECSHLRFEGNTTSLNISVHRPDGVFELLTTFSVKKTERLKLSYHFSAMNRTSKYGFNTTYLVNYITVTMNDTILHEFKEDDYIGIPTDCDSIYSVKFEKHLDNTAIKFDNYYLYAGTDFTAIGERYTPQFSSDLVQLQEETFLSNISTTDETGSRDFAEVMKNFWGTVGLKSTASKILFALVIMVIITGMTVFLFISNHVEVKGSVVLVIDLFVMLVFVYLGLLPVWLIILMVIGGAGMGAFFVNREVSR